MVRADLGSGLICPRTQTCMDSKVVRADFGSGLICPRAQTCCALKSSAPSGAHQDNCADLLGLQTRQGSNHSTAHVGESNSRSNVFQIRHAFVCVSSRWKVLSGEFRRRPTSLAIKSHKPDRVGRRGLSEPREDFSRLNTYAFPWLCLWLCLWLFPSRICLRANTLESSLGRVPHAAWRRMFTVKRAEIIVIPNTNHANACSRRNRMLDCESISWCFFSAIFTGTLPS